MRSLQELTTPQNSAIGKLKRWVSAAENNVEILPPSDRRDESLVTVQVAIDDPLGAIAYETGGILIDHGWLRFLGSGHARLPRNLADWNRDRCRAFCLVADDAVGGFFAVNRGEWGDDPSALHYWSPDSLAWEPVGFAFADFLEWALTPCLADFYQNLRWKTWKKDMGELGGDQCFAFEPFLWAKDGSIRTSSRRIAPVAEVFEAKLRSSSE
jgi:hypothetical protein